MNDDYHSGLAKAMQSCNIYNDSLVLKAEEKSVSRTATYLTSEI